MGEASEMRTQMAKRHGGGNLTRPNIESPSSNNRIPSVSGRVFVRDARGEPDAADLHVRFYHGAATSSRSFTGRPIGMRRGAALRMAVSPKLRDANVAQSVRDGSSSMPGPATCVLTGYTTREKHAEGSMDQTQLQRILADSRRAPMTSWYDPAVLVRAGLRATHSPRAMWIVSCASSSLECS